MTLVDTNVLIDGLTHDPAWLGWSVEHVARQAARGPLVINEVIYAEVSVGFETEEAVAAALEELAVDLVQTPALTLFLTG